MTTALPGSLPALHKTLLTRGPGMMPTHQCLLSSPGSVSFSLQVLEGLQEVALGQVSVDTQARHPSGARAKPRASFWCGKQSEYRNVSQVCPGHWRSVSAEPRCSEQLSRTRESTTGPWVLLLCSAESWIEEAVGANGAQWGCSTQQGFRKASGGEGMII